MNSYRRIMLRDSRPNPLFEDWIGELLTEAVEKKSRLEPMLREAFESIKKYPLRLECGTDGIILKGFHKNLCDFLDQRLAVYNSIINEELEEGRGAIQDLDERGNIIHERIISSSTAPPADGFTDDSNEQDLPTPCSPDIVDRMPKRRSGSYITNLTKRKKDVINSPGTENGNLSNIGNQSKYKPRYKTVNFAILFALLEHSKSNSSGGLTKLQLAKLAQKYCDHVLINNETATCNSSLINANVSWLVRKGYVLVTRQRRIEYHMTPKGKKLTLQLVKNYKSNLINIEKYRFAFMPDSEVQDNNENNTENRQADEAIHFPAGSYDIILLIDKNETSGATNKNDPTVALFNKYPDLKHEYRSLKVGDFAWIAQHRDTKQELVLPHIVERKRMDDLAASIKDGRFHEQKFRLRKVGVSAVIYLLEAHGKNKNLGLPLQTLKQAMANTRIQNGYKILSSSSLAHSVRLLSMLTNKIISDYELKPLKGRNGPPGIDELHTYQYFSGVMAKNKSLTVNGLFLKQLLQLKGLSVEKALAISLKYPTPYLLIEEYRKLDPYDGEMLLAFLKYGDTVRNVGRNISKAVYDLFTRRVAQ